MYHAKMLRCHQCTRFRIVLAETLVKSHNLCTPLLPVVRSTCAAIVAWVFLFLYLATMNLTCICIWCPICLQNWQQYCTCYFFQWIDGPEVYDDYLLSPYVWMHKGPWPAETWTRLVRPPPTPPALWKLDETTPKAPPLVWCEHCQDMTRWCPLYGADTLDESWKVFDEEQRQKDEIRHRERKRKKG